MGKEYRCRSCHKAFSSKKALKEHNRTKHRLKGFIRIGLYLAIFAVIAGYAVYSGALASVGELLQSTRPDEPEARLVMHIHSELAIVIDGERVAIPNGIGMKPELWVDRSLEGYGEEGMSPIHTHDGSGKIHVESTVNRDYTIGEFFDVWGVQFNETCIMNRCSGGGYVVEMYVNGERNFQFRDQVLRDDAKISIEYRKQS